MQKPAYSMSIVTVKPNETVPDALLIKLFSENRSAVGLVVRNGTVIDVEKFTEMDSVEDEVKEYRGILEKTKAYYRQICLSALPAGFDASEVQPWVILKDSKGLPILTVSCEGDFSKHTKEGQSEFFTLVNDYLGPKIEGLYKMVGNDPKKLMDYLRSKEFATDLEQVYGHRGVFEFMPAEGEPFAHGTNELGVEAAWGRASNVYGYTEAIQEAGTAEVKPATEAPKRSKYADDPAPKVEPVATPPKADPPKDPIEKVAAELPKKFRQDIPRNLHGKRKKSFIRDLYVQHTGKEELPPNWDDMTFVEFEMQTTVNSLADLGKTALAPKDMKGAAPTPLKSNISENAPVPVISGAEQAAVTAFIKKYLDGNSNRVENPLEIQKMEAKLPVFTEVAGQADGLDFFDGVRSDILKNLVEERPQSAWLLILEYRADRRKRKALMLQGDKKLSDLAGTEVPLEEPGKTLPASPTPGTVSPPEPEIKKSRYA